MKNNTLISRASVITDPKGAYHFESNRATLQIALSPSVKRPLAAQTKFPCVLSCFLGTMPLDNWLIRSRLSCSFVYRGSKGLVARFF